LATKKVTKSVSESESKIPVMTERKWATAGWALLLLGGLAHMLPAQMAPLLQWSMYGVSVQMAVGVASVVLALYFLLGND
jgi:hypothetical protein